MRVVNNAAIGPLGTVLDTDEALFDRIMAVNLKGPYLTSRAVIPHMIGQRRRFDHQHRIRRRLGQAEHGCLQRQQRRGDGAECGDGLRFLP